MRASRTRAQQSNNYEGVLDYLRLERSRPAWAASDAHDAIASWHGVLRNECMGIRGLRGFLRVVPDLHVVPHAQRANEARVSVRPPFGAGAGAGAGPTFGRTNF